MRFEGPHVCHGDIDREGERGFQGNGRDQLLGVKGAFTMTGPFADREGLGVMKLV